VRGTWEEVFAGIDKIEAERVAARVRRFDRDDAEAAGWIVRAQTQTRAGQVWVGIKPLPRLPEHISYDAEECVEHTIHGDDLYDVLRQIETIEKGKPQ
jgi:hypothetical protein